MNAFLPRPPSSAAFRPALLPWLSAWLLMLAWLAWPAGNATAQTGDPTVTQVASGDYHTCALTSTGAVKCWGNNYAGQLGSTTNSGSVAPNNSPLDVQGLDSGAVAIATGEQHTCALTSVGAVKCWGYNYFGQLGSTTNSGTNTANNSPLDVQTLGSGVAAITAGREHSCALTRAGAVKCWGTNTWGQLGSTTNSGNTTTNNSPLDVQGLNSGVVAISAGYYHTCALSSAGAVTCWGRNQYGQLGSTTNSGINTANNSPLPVQTLDSGVVAISAGFYHTCALTSAGAVKCWGYNYFGQLGSTTNSGTNTANNSPLPVQTLDSDVVTIATGLQHTCALTSAGAVKCWGKNHYGQLGSTTNSGTEAPNNSPLEVQGLDSGVAAIAAGDDHTCALTSAGALKCWGWNHRGQLGSTTNSGSLNPNNSPLDVQTLSNIQPAGQSISFDPPASIGHGTSISLSATASSGETVVFDTWTPDTCTLTGNVLTALTGALCGVRASQPGSDDYAAAPQQLRLIQVGDPTVTQVATGDDHSCALTNAGAVTCWGMNRYGQLGNTINSGIDTANNSPLDVQGLSSGVVAIAAGQHHTCALTSTGAVKCWGRNFLGQLGSTTNSGNSNPNNNPLDVQGLSSGVVAIAAGNNHTCALTRTGAVKCWGWNFLGQLGSTTNSGINTANTSPLDVQTLDSGVVAIAAGGSHTCALTRAGAVKCWGYNLSGQLGSTTNSGTFNANTSPLDVQTLDSGVVTIAAGEQHTCALTSTGTAKCWGMNRYGQLGSTTNSGTFDPNSSPLDVQTLDIGVVTIATGVYHTCALTSAGAVKCWGWNTSGQLGNTTNSGIDAANTSPLDVQTLGSGVVAIAAGFSHACALTSAGAVKCWGSNYYGQIGSTTNSSISTPNNLPLDVQTLSNILPAGQSISFDPPASMLRGSNLTLSATATSGEDVVFGTWTPDTCTLTGNTLTATSTELCGVRASQPGSSDYAAAPHQLRLIGITRNDLLSVTVIGQGSVEVAPDPLAGGIDVCTQDDSPCIAQYVDGDATDLTFTATPTTGWQLTGWSGDCTEDGTDPLLATLTLDAHKTCNASFAINTYTVTFEDWNGDVLDTQTVNHGNPATAPNDPTREGYTFTGWDAPFDAVTSNLTLTAQYTINAYTLSFDAQGGDTVPPITQDYATTAVVPAATRTGHAFDGWNTAPDGSGTAYAAGSLFTFPANDVTLYAQWTINQYTVTFVDWDGAELAVQTVEHGNPATAPTSPSRIGYTFAGWDAPFDAVTSNLLITAHYTINTYTLSFDPQGGDAVAAITQDYATTAVLPGTTRTGYGFDGWNTAPDGSGTAYAAGSLFTFPANDVTLYAQWTINQYTVTFVDWDGAELAMHTVEHGNPATAPISPSRIGYTFTGWDAPFDAVTSNLTVTAQYTINAYTLSFDPQGGDAVAPITQDYATTVALPNTTRTGHGFNGWNTAADGSGTAYAAGSSFTFPANNVTLYAQWSINQYTVTTSGSDANGTITPPSQMVDHGSAAHFDVTVKAGHHALLNGDTCTPADNGDGTWSAANLVEDCSVVASFPQNLADVVIRHGGNGQSTPVLDHFANALAVRVTDADDVPLQGIPVTFTASTSGASAVLSSTTATTDASGIASITATANAISGSYAVTAHVGGVTTPAVFTLDNTALTATLVLTTSSPVIPHDGTVTLIAAISGADELMPSGTVDFLVDGVIVCAAVTVDIAGIATCESGPFAPGQHAVSVNYSGDAAYAAAANAGAIGFGVAANAPVMVPVNSAAIMALLMALIGLIGLVTLRRAKRS